MEFEGDYVKVICANCRREVSSKFFDTMIKSIEVEVEECVECFEKRHCPDCTAGYADGYEDGHVAGFQVGYSEGRDSEADSK